MEKAARLRSIILDAALLLKDETAAAGSHHESDSEANNTHRPLPDCVHTLRYCLAEHSIHSEDHEDICRKHTGGNSEDMYVAYLDPL
jgi:hypothetical protein